MNQWIKVKGYENYSVSPEGQVRNDKTGRILRPRRQTQGYVQVHLCRNGKVVQHLVHRLVAEAFLPNPEQYPCVNHINEDKSDNRVENLEWCTKQYNNNYGTRDMRRKCVLDGIGFPSITDAAESISVHPNILTAVLSQGRTKYKNHSIQYVS